MKAVSFENPNPTVGSARGVGCLPDSYYTTIGPVCPCKISTSSYKPFIYFYLEDDPGADMGSGRRWRGVPPPMNSKMKAYEICIS